jgi:hypothetical protein
MPGCSSRRRGGREKGVPSPGKLVPVRQPTVTVGVDLAGSPANTAACTLRWEAGQAAVVAVDAGVDDASFLRLLRELPHGAKLGLDCPLGWPVRFVEAVAAHAGREPWPARGGDGDRGALRWRATDRWVRDLTGRWPLSVSTDRLGVPALRSAYLLDVWEADGGTVDRSGLTGPVVEVYPAAARRAWGLGWARSVEALEARLPLRFEGPAVRARCVADENCFDALVAALVARAAGLGRTSPPPAELTEVAGAEGWIHVPNCPIEELV